MKTFRMFGIEINFHLSIQRVKRIKIDLPDDADDAHLRHGFRDGGINGGGEIQWNTSDGFDKIVYFIDGSTKVEIDIPKCKKSVEVFLTPLYDIQKRREGIVPCYSSNRKIIVDLYF